MFPVSKHSDVLTCIETRLSMLSMTYQKYINNGTACFIPGKVIDECYKILRSISANDARNMRAHEILQELRDISSMAIEHFDEKIVPDIKRTSQDERNVSISSIYDMFIASPRAGLTLNLSRNSSSSSLSSPRDDLVVRPKSKLSSVLSMYKKQSKIIKGQSKQIAKLLKTMKVMKRRLDETDTKNREMTESIRQLKSTSKPAEVAESVPPAKKTRTATVLLKRRLNDE